ncbi:ATP-dependent DNA helicase [Rhodocaloribacter sp.]
MSTPTTFLQHLAFSPTNDQQEALTCLDRFLDSPTTDVFVLRGAAGTGKTSLTSAITAGLHDQDRRFHLLAPTGRAARVIGQKTCFAARTIHSLIYTPESLEDRATIRMVRKTNDESELNVYIVDESSMVSDVQDPANTFITPRPLLTDFFDFVKQGNPRNKVLFIGDTYQLPPVNSTSSPALDATYLETQFVFTVQQTELSEVKRQSGDSYILENASRLREAMATKQRTPQIRARRLSSPYETVDRFLDSRDSNRADAATMMAWTNRDVNWMNRTCRQRLRIARRTLAPGEPVILHRPWVSAGHWLVNGEQGIVKSVGSSMQYAGLSFVEVRIVFLDEDGREFLIDALALADVLESEKGLLSPEQEQTLYRQAIKDNHIFRESRRLSDDEYVGALRLRYGYALTTHKAQGGEWDQVFLHPYINPDPRWQYTAVTRAKKELFSYRHPQPGCDFISFLN